MFERYFFGCVSDIMPGMCSGVKCVETAGSAPKQLQTIDPIDAKNKNTTNDWEIDDDFYGDSQYDDGDLDFESYQDLSFDDGSMF